MIEIYEYTKGYLKGFSKPKTGLKIGSTGESEEEIRKRSLSRAKTKIRRLINSNHGQYGKEFTSKFLTLSFGENVTDLDIAHYEFTKFIKRLNYEIFETKKSNIKYIAIVEFQERGSVHYHVVIFNIPYVKQSILTERWGNGHVWINKIDDVDNVGAYVAEYLGQADKGQGKSPLDPRLKGRKSYFSSRGLFKPLEITDKKIVETVSAALPLENLTYTSSFDNEHVGHVIYKQYNLSI